MILERPLGSIYIYAKLGLLTYSEKRYARQKN
jgi:hypothetical protein